MSVHDHLHRELDALAGMLRQRVRPPFDFKAYRAAVLHAEAELGWEGLLDFMQAQFREQAQTHIEPNGSFDDGHKNPTEQSCRGREHQSPCL